MEALGEMKEKIYQVEIVRRWYDFTEVREQRSTRYMYSGSLSKYMGDLVKEGFIKINESTLVHDECTININEAVIENRIKKSLDILKSNFDTVRSYNWDYIESQLKSTMIEETEKMAKKNIESELYKVIKWRSTVKISAIPEDELEFIVAE